MPSSALAVLVPCTSISFLAYIKAANAKFHVLQLSPLLCQISRPWPSVMLITEGSDDLPLKGQWGGYKPFSLDERVCFHRPHKSPDYLKCMTKAIHVLGIWAIF
jgi:hypothetical protein